MTEYTNVFNAPSSVIARLLSRSIFYREWWRYFGSRVAIQAMSIGDRDDRLHDNRRPIDTSAQTVSGVSLHGVVRHECMHSAHLYHFQNRSFGEQPCDRSSSMRSLSRGCARLLKIIASLAFFGLSLLAQITPCACLTACRYRHRAF